MSELFEPYSIGGLELKNRFVRSATWDNTADKSGAVTDNSVAIYNALGRGGVGLIVTGYAYVSPEGQAMPGQYGAHTDQMLPGLTRLVQAAHQGGAKIALQIVHAGINSIYIHRIGLVAMVVSSKKGRRPHREMDDEDIERIISDFASAAIRAREAGFDAVQLHGAHGYLMSQFISPLFNHRTDQWGGNTENRRRFHLELVSRVRQAIGDDFPLLIKFGAQDDRKDGLPLSEGLETARQMVTKGIDAIEVSTGVAFEKVAPIRAKGDPESLPFRERASALKQAVNVPVILVGGIRSLQMAKNVIDSGDADLISMCRPFLREPDLIARWQRGEQWSAKCISCGRCRPRKSEPVRCNIEPN